VRALLLLVVLAGCGPALPDPETPGAAVYRGRCGGCHRLFPPGSMTAEMWNVQVARMRGEFARRGIPWLGAEEEQTLLRYLGEHAGQS
jgi:mono/diheme cytochrome c family protein